MPKLDVVVASDVNSVGVGVMVSVGTGELVDETLEESCVSSKGEGVPVLLEHELRIMVKTSSNGRRFLTR